MSVSPPERDQKFRLVIKDLYEGELLRAAVAKHGMTLHEFHSHRISSATLTELYEDAKRCRAELYAEEIVDIADNEPDPQKARVRTENRRWYASKILPKTYGDRIDLNLNQPVDVSAALAAARARALARCSPAGIEDAQIIEPLQLSQDVPAVLGAEVRTQVEHIAVSKADEDDADLAGCPSDDVDDIFS